MKKNVRHCVSLPDHHPSMEDLAEPVNLVRHSEGKTGRGAFPIFAHRHAGCE